jgi:hypothetical protein
MATHMDQHRAINKPEVTTGKERNTQKTTTKNP